MHIQIINNQVYRPAGYWTENVHKLLNYLHAYNFKIVPKPLELNTATKQEILSYLPGKVYHDFSSDASRSDEFLISSAQLLRKYHDVTSKFILENDLSNSKWQLTTQEPVEVICHNDFAPYNIVVGNDSKLMA